ncbi:MAG: tetratricopeptide repeat protein [Planctomycetaceae bacterium]
MPDNRQSHTVVQPSTTGNGDGSAGPPWRQLLQSVHQADRLHDVALLNLVCTSELRGASSLPIEHYLEWLDDVAAKVRLATERNYFKFLDAPEVFENSQARFCMVCLVTVLQRECGVRYNPKWQGLTPDSPVPEAFGIDANDLFVHAIIDGIGGTCGSLPVLYVAVGRRLGYPLRLVKAARHLFVRWDDPDGKLWHHSDRFNVEATGPGIHFLPDDHYRTWPHAISAEDVEAGIFLRSLSPQEELAEFIATRGYCLKANGRLKEAVEAFAEASRLAPHNRHFAANHKSLQMHLMMRQRGHAFLNAPVRTFDQEAVGSFWVAGLGGHKVLVQIVSPVTQPFAPQPEVGVSLVRQSLQTPNGLHVDAWLPVLSAGSSMTAHWVRLPDGRLALVHKPASDTWSQPWQVPNRDQRGYGQPIVPDGDHGLGMPWSGSFVAVDQAGLAPHEQSYLAGQIQQTVERIQTGHSMPALPSMQPLAIPAGPAAPRLPQTAIGIPFIT